MLDVFTANETWIGITAIEAAAVGFYALWNIFNGKPPLTPPGWLIWTLRRIPAFRRWYDGRENKRRSAALIWARKR